MRKIHGGVFTVDIAIRGNCVLTFKGCCSSGYYNDNSIDFFGFFSSANGASAVFKCAIAGFGFSASALSVVLFFINLVGSPIAKYVLTCFRNKFCFCSSANRTSIRFDTLLKVSGLFCYSTVVKCTIGSFCCATITRTSMLIFVCRIRCPVAKYVLTCFRNRFCFCSSAYRTSIGFDTFLKVSRILRYNAVIERTISRFNLTAITAASMFGFVGGIRRPIAKSVLIRFCNEFCFGSSANRTSISLYTFLKMSRILRYNTVIERTISRFNLTAITSTSMLIFVCRIRCPIAKSVLTCFFNGFCFCSSANRASISLYAFFKVSRFLRYNTTVKRTVTCFDLATITSTSMLIFVCRIRCPIAKYVFTCFRNRFCFCSSAYRASIRLYTLFKMSRFLRYNATVKCTVTCFDLATITSTSMLIFVCRIRCPIPEPVFGCFRNGFRFGSSANRTGIRFDTLLKVSRFFCYNTTVKRTVTCFDLATITTTSMLVFVSIILHPPAEAMYVFGRSHFRDDKVGKTACFK